MNITFLVGNGFDLNLGLPTRFSDFIRYYNSKDHNDIIAKEMKENYEYWSDLEVALGQFVGKIDEDQVKAFIESKVLLERGLADYWHKVKNDYELKITEQGINEFKRQVVDFYTEFNKTYREEINDVIKRTKESIHYQFITFNYTDYLDTIITEASNSGVFGTHSAGTTFQDYVLPPLHVHGSVLSDMVLGVNDKTQMSGKATVKSRLSEFMLKPRLNDTLGEQRTNDAKNMIFGSHYVCVYGMSFGITDLMWWKKIYEWLNQSKFHRLIIYTRMNIADLPSATAKTQKLIQIKRRFLQFVEKEEESSVANKIIVVPHTRMFTFKNIKAIPKAE